jgi:hypothetical protein
MVQVKKRRSFYLFSSIFIVIVVVVVVVVVVVHLHIGTSHSIWSKINVEGLNVDSSTSLCKMLALGNSFDYSDDRQYEKRKRR